MKKAGLLVMAALLLVGGCYNLKGDFSPTETYVSSYEIAGAIYPLAKVYFARLEETGVLTDPLLLNYKIGYAEAKGLGVLAGDALKKYINEPNSAIIANYPAILQQAAVLLADLSGGILVKSPALKSWNEKKFGKEYIPGFRFAIPPEAKRAVSIENRKMAVTPDQIILTVNLLMIALDKIMAHYGVAESLTEEDKLLYSNRVKFTQSSIPDWR